MILRQLLSFLLHKLIQLRVSHGRAHFSHLNYAQTYTVKNIKIFLYNLFKTLQ